MKKNTFLIVIAFLAISFTACKKENPTPNNSTPIDNNEPTPVNNVNKMSGTYTFDGNTVVDLNDDNFTAFALHIGGSNTITITSSVVINGKTYDLKLDVSNSQLQNGLAGFVGKYEYSILYDEITESANAGRTVSSDLSVSNGEENDPNEKYYSVVGANTDGSYNVLNITESSANGIKGNFEGTIKDDNNSVKIVLNFNSIPPKFSTYGF